jgi:hypothetical protein
MMYLVREVLPKEDSDEDVSDEDVVVNSTTDISGDEESGSDFKPQKGKWTHCESETNSSHSDEDIAIAATIADTISKLGSEDENDE